MVHFRLNAPVSFPFQPFGALSVEWLRQASLRKSERFGKLAADWWDPNGASAMLHKLNPVRLKYVRDQIDQHWQCDECSRRPWRKERARRRLRRRI